MISVQLGNLLDAIGSKEAPKGYGQIYSGARGVPKDTDVSKMTLDQVLNLQFRMLKAESASSACGRYQFLRKTLISTMNQMRLTGSELWDAKLQDRMAVHLMDGRGLKIYMAGNMSRDSFCNNLAMEWASLPVVTRIQGQKRVVNPGESYYAGDGLNKSHHKPETIQALVAALRTGDIATPAQPDAPVIVSAPTADAAPQRKRGLLLALIELLQSIFKWK